MTGPSCRAVVFATEHMALADFYREVVGMRELRRDADHVSLESGGFQLVLHRIPEQHGKGIVISVPPVVRERQSIKLCFPVSDLAKCREIASRAGGFVYETTREWRDERSRICDGYDPEGNVFQIYQPLSP
jgi:predicted enzyme related to lactoylglutathione lyase